MPDRSLPACVAGIDVGGTNIRFALADASAPDRLLVHRSARTPKTDGRDAFLDFADAEIGACLRDAGLPPECVAAVGCATPGIVDADAGLVLTASNLGWNDLPLPALLSERFGVPAVVENDVRAAAVGEHRFGAGRGRSSLVYLTVSTGVSAGIIVHGRPLRGHHHMAGEIAYFVPDPVHLGGDWGENGCLESTSAGVGLARTWAARNGGNGHPEEAETVFAMARSGDAEARMLVERAADYLSQAAIAIGTLIDPEIVVIGGGIALNESWIVDRIRQVTASMLPFPYEIAITSLGGEAPLVGALALAADAAH
jgi:glucokinase